MRIVGNIVPALGDRCRTAGEIVHSALMTTRMSVTLLLSNQRVFWIRRVSALNTGVTHARAERYRSYGRKWLVPNNCRQTAGRCRLRTRRVRWSSADLRREDSIQASFTSWLRFFHWNNWQPQKERKRWDTRHTHTLTTTINISGISFQERISFRCRKPTGSVFEWVGLFSIVMLDAVETVGRREIMARCGRRLPQLLLLLLRLSTTTDLARWRKRNGFCTIALTSSCHLYRKPVSTNPLVQLVKHFLTNSWSIYTDTTIFLFDYSTYKGSYPKKEKLIA